MGGPSNPQYKSPAYQTWDSMLQRCNNPNCSAYKNYGARGITVSKEWINFHKFYEDMGSRPYGKTLERIDNSFGYSKENCKWASRKEQQNNIRTNRMIYFNGEMKTLSQWADKIKIPYSTLSARINRGMTIERAITKKNTKFGHSDNYQSRQTHCKRGHIFDKKNTYFKDKKRHCRTCRMNNRKQIKNETR